MAGSDEEHVWKPALAEIEEALVPAFIIEEFEDGRFTVSGGNFKTTESPLVNAKTFFFAVKFREWSFLMMATPGIA